MSEADIPPISRATWRAYVSTFCCCSAMIVVAVSCLNYAVDPYLTHQWDSPLLQRMRPSREKLSAWGKTYAVAKYRPAVVYVGNSRTELGLPVDPSMFAGKTVFNTAVSGAALGEVITLVQHAARHSRLEAVVWGIDAPTFSLASGSAGLEPELTNSGPFFFFRRAVLNLKRGLTVDMTEDSLRLLSGSFGSVCRSSLALYGKRDDACFDPRTAGGIHTGTAFGPRLREFRRGDGPTGAALRAFDQTLADLCRAGTQVRLYINPTHALTLDVLYWTGKWPKMEQWQIDLARMVERYRAGGCDLRLYDFSGFNSVTTETISMVSRRPVMDNYWEASHYRANVGHMILGRIYGEPGPGPVPPDDFGVELDSAMLPAHLARMRAARERYHVEHARETAYLKAVLAAPSNEVLKISVPEE